MADESKQGSIGLADVWAGRGPRVLYLVGEAPFVSRPDCEFVIAQDTYLPPFEVDVFLPAASFAEAEGTITNIEGRVQALAQIEHLADAYLRNNEPGRARQLYEKVLQLDPAKEAVKKKLLGIPQ